MSITLRALALPPALFPMAASGQVLFDSIATPLPGNISSLAYQATQTSEFGTGVILAPGTPRIASSVSVIMSSWGCVSGAWFTGATLHPVPVVGLGPAAGPSMGLSESTFVNASISEAEATRMSQLCAFIQANGLGFGICKSCRTGGLGGAKK